MAVLAAAVFTTSTAAAHADGMSAGTWDGRITGGTLSLGNGDLRPIAVPAGDPFTFTIPTGASAPVAFKAPATHISVPLKKVNDGGTQWAVAGHVDLSAIAGSVDPASGAVTGTATAHGLLHLDLAPASGPSSSLYCHLGDPPASAADPAAPAPFAVNLAGDTTLTAALGVTLDCGVPIGLTALPIIGDPLLPGSELTLTATFTRRPDPTPPAPSVKPPATTPKPSTNPPKFTPPAVKCVVPKLTGLKLKQARKAVKKANCAVGTIKRKKSTKRSTTVLKQAKRAGVVLAKGSKITLTIAR
jgi:PASTA domain-containing protein